MIVTDEMICAWLNEREQNARRTAAADSGSSGRPLDADYYHRAAEAIEYYKTAYSRTLNANAGLFRACGVHQKRIEKLEAALWTIRSIFENRQMSTASVAREMLRVAISALGPDREVSV